jgi:hypothetical protein
MLYIITEDQLRECINKIGADGLIDPKDVRSKAIKTNSNCNYTILADKVYEETLKEVK